MNVDELYGDLPRQEETVGLIGRIGRHPEGLLLVVAGCALLAGLGRRAVRAQPLRETARSGMQAGRSYGEAASQTATAWGRSAATMGAGASQGVAAAADRIVSSVGSLGGAAGSLARGAGAQASALRQRLPDAGALVRTAKNPLEDIVSTVADQPLILAAAALAAGAAAGAVLPSTAFEGGVFGDARDKVIDSVMKSASEQLDRLRRARDAAESKLKEEAQEHGLTPEGLKEMAKEVADAAMEGAGEGRRPKADAGSRTKR